MGPQGDPVVSTTPSYIGIPTTAVAGIELIEQLDIKRADPELLLMEASIMEKDGGALPWIGGWRIAESLHGLDTVEARIQDNR
ncbi:MAG: hypothetical protein ACKOFN_04365 [Vulcanococcus sp.]